MKLPKGFSSKYLSQKNATELLLAGAKKWGIELNSQIATDVRIKFKHDMKFFNRDNIKTLSQNPELFSPKLLRQSDNRTNPSRRIPLTVTGVPAAQISPTPNTTAGKIIFKCR